MPWRSAALAALSFVTLVGCQGATRGVVRGQVVPGGQQTREISVNALVHVLDADGRQVLTRQATATGFDIRLAPGRYRLVAAYQDESCGAEVHVRAGRTVNADLLCRGK
jgi:hypothetical protein